jgi:hypothetical protein|tara:strand:+ start:837 stop:1046 length:210 start_codon:yes stop_codon:yes gene_type:complete
MEVWIILIVIIFLVWRSISSNKYSKVSKSERIKDLPSMTKEEYINMYNVGTDISKFNLGKEWENEKKNK